MSDTTKNVNIKVKSDGAPLKTLNAEIRKTKEEVAKTALEFGKSSKEFQNASAKLKGLQTQFTGLKKTVADAGNQIKMSKFQLLEFGENLTVITAGLSVIAGKVANFGIDAFKLGSAFQEMSSNFVGSARDLELFRKATAGTVTDGGLIQLSNYASDLGVSLKDQALLFSLAEDAADKYGGTTEENFQRVINATDGSAKGLRAIGIGVKEYNKELEKLLPNNVKNIDDLDAETQQQIRLEAIIKAKGITIDDVTKKQQSNADKMQELSHLYEEFSTSVGVAMSESIKLGDGMEGLTDKTKTLGSALGSVLADGLDIVSQMLKQDAEDITKLNNLFTNLLEFIKTMDSMNISDKISFLMNGGVSMINTQGGNVNQPLNTFPPEFTIGGNLKLPTPNFDTSITNKSGSKGGSTNRTDTLSEAEKKKLAEQEAILSINSKGQAEFFELTKIKVPYTTDNKGVQPDWMAGMSDKELQSFLALNNTPSNEPSTLVDDSQTIYNNISGLMNILNVGTDTFVSKLLAGFGTAYQILDIATSILSFIPGFGSIFGRASGGMVNAGGTYLVGERGPEILRMSGSGGMVYNNSQTNKLMNTALNRQNPVNVYVSSNIDQRYLKVGIEKYNSNQKYIRA